MSYRVDLERFGAVVTVDTIAEVKELLEAIYPIVTIRADIRIPPHIAGLPGDVEELPDTSAEAAVRSERGLLELMRDRPRRLQELADASGMGRATALEYLKRMAAADQCHQEGRGPATRWAIGPGPKEEP